ncbi:MAG: tail protein X [Lachnospiraceae bacterium]|nr:tail protein X [Lachnospiraceae bacterium]
MSRVSAYYEYTTVEGDTFDDLALYMYGDEKLSHYIIDFNPDYSDVLIFPANVELKLPEIEGMNTPDTLPPWKRQNVDEDEVEEDEGDDEDDEEEES